MNENEKDAKQEVESSPTPVVAAPQKDDKPIAEAPSPSSNRPAVQTEEPTFEETLAKVADESLSRQAADDSNAELSSITKGEEGKGKSSSEEKPGSKEAPTSELEKPVEEKVPEEFHKHPAWQRIIEERDEAKKQLETVKAGAEANQSLLRFCQERSISEQQFQSVLELASLVNTDPSKALEQLKPIVENLEAQTGKKLPTDIQKKVDEGLLDPETAAEVARLRAERGLSEKRQQVATQTEQQRSLASTVQALNDWNKAMLKSDPDFGKKVEMVKGIFLSLFNAVDASGRPINPIRHPQDAVALVEKAYKTVNEQIRSFVPNKTEQRVLTSTGASTKQVERAPKSTAEAVDKMLREKHGTSLE